MASVNLNNVNNVDTSGKEMPGQSGAIGAGAFHAGGMDDPVAGSPVQELLVSAEVGGELLITE
jgi:hypothetical protein